MALITETITRLVCDFDHAGENVAAVGKVKPSGKDACKVHFDEFLKEIKLPNSLGGDMSGYKVSTDAGFTPKFKIEFIQE